MPNLSILSCDILRVGINSGGWMGREGRFLRGSTDKLVWLDRDVSAHEVKALRKREPISMRTLKYRAGLELLASGLTSM